MNQLIVSVGGTAHIVAEIIGFLNHRDYPLYCNHVGLPKLTQIRKIYRLHRIDKIIMACTNRSYTSTKDVIERWKKAQDLDIALEFHYLSEMEDINSELDSRAMRNLIYSLVYNYRNKEKADELYLCLSGGRKTMSSDMQQAANIFGCKAMLHILAEGLVDFDLEKDPHTIPAEVINRITPVVYQANVSASYLSGMVDADKSVLPQFICCGSEFNYPAKGISFLEAIERLQEQQDNLAINYYQQLQESEAGSSFQALPLLKPELITALKNSYIGENDLGWIYSLPKTDLHCHLGGIADSKGLVDIAFANHKHFTGLSGIISILKETKEAIDKRDTATLQETALGILHKEKARRWLELSAFLSCFDNEYTLLDRIVYEELIQPRNFRAIGLARFEKIGDYQGSSLLQSEEALRASARILKRDAEKNNLIYKELRCSPWNYTEILTAREVVEILWDELKDHSCCFRLVIIGSRHRSEEALRKHVELCLDLKREGGELAGFICGFDLAGSEGIVDTAKLRETIQPLLEACTKITIHAGETSSVEDIWRAVYQLNADRIGHGLSLAENRSLMQKLKDHRTAAELCPSSNFQISGFRDYMDVSTEDFKQYPLREYLQQGIKACICTDDPGLSGTDISREYLKASHMTEGGLSRWEVLILLRNGFVSAFLPYSKKQELIRTAEKQVLSLVQARS